MKTFKLALMAGIILVACSCSRSSQDATPEQITAQYTFADTAILHVAKMDADAVISKDVNDPTLENDLLNIRAKEEHMRQVGLTHTADLYIAAIEKRITEHKPELAKAMGL